MALKKLLAVSATMAVAVLGAALQAADECDSGEPSAELVAAAVQMAANDKVAAAFASTEKRADVDVPTYVHVISSSNSESDGNISDDKVRAGIDVMNTNYAGSGFKFTLKDIDHTINADWTTTEKKAMKDKLHKGDFKTLNLYLLPSFIRSEDDKTSLNGRCTFPDSNSASAPKPDGCIVRTKAWDNKQTTTHEVGHWLGLFHTFQGETSSKSCDANNDYVDDTPAMKKDSKDCSGDADTCPSAGKDPVTNFMSYAACRTKFTSGQFTRMKTMYNKYRA
ncbi:metalloprotease 1 [Cordyceps fumosorosea ARSEF 2679]|uniref:Metalloprotease 1 n=1 Tax=Cordyceps fumosorosea (strain ARSEF 2679) TaxID=1081104 RepID=A0A167UGJ9_CORFA|nr:metalloprotease 1 [Cordyceps fumosorosea ARSEF 2679]OAA61558.1 metalloprotease 1 [Cordyceps fumosorosea ARSEF 2679]